MKPKPLQRRANPSVAIRSLGSTCCISFTISWKPPHSTSLAITMVLGATIALQRVMMVPRTPPVIRNTVASVTLNRSINTDIAQQPSRVDVSSLAKTHIVQSQGAVQEP